MVDRFAIYRSVSRATDIKIHDIECSAYTGRDPLAENSDWHTASTLQKAYKIANDLAKEHGMDPPHDCKKCNPSSLYNQSA